jgi:hypothetical protein
VVVSGSHGGISAALFAAHAQVSAAIFNDAGVGKEQAGIRGLELLNSVGIAAATVDFRSARIGDAQDALASGFISFVNALGQDHGLTVGMQTAEAVEVEVSFEGIFASAQPALPPPADEALPLAIGGGEVFLVDSASAINQEMAGRVVVTGSHGGLPAGRATRALVAAALFNDAGVGKDQAGIRRLDALDDLQIPALTVDWRSARIGDARDTIKSGIVSYKNRSASRLGVRRSESAMCAAERFLDYAKSRGR